MIFVESHRKSIVNLQRMYPYAKIIDLTSKSNNEFVKFSPFYPHGNIPVPFTHNIFSYSVEGIWQGLKVFETKGVDMSKFMIRDMKGIKRSIATNGRILGHSKGIMGDTILDYKTARTEIFIKSYFWVLENRLQNELSILERFAKEMDLVFLDYETNIDLNNFNKPISHAGLVKLYLDNKTKPFLAPKQMKLNL